MLSPFTRSASRASKVIVVASQRSNSDLPDISRSLGILMFDWVDLSCFLGRLGASVRSILFHL